MKQTTIDACFASAVCPRITKAVLADWRDIGFNETMRHSTGATLSEVLLQSGRWSNIDTLLNAGWLRDFTIPEAYQTSALLANADEALSERFLALIPPQVLETHENHYIQESLRHESALRAVIEGRWPMRPIDRWPYADYEEYDTLAVCILRILANTDHDHSAMILLESLLKPTTSDPYTVLDPLEHHEDLVMIGEIPIDQYAELARVNIWSHSVLMANQQGILLIPRDNAPDSVRDTIPDPSNWAGFCQPLYNPESTFVWDGADLVATSVYELSRSSHWTGDPSEIGSAWI